MMEYFNAYIKVSDCRWWRHIADAWHDVKIYYTFAGPPFHLSVPPHVDGRYSPHSQHSCMLVLSMSTWILNYILWSQMIQGTENGMIGMLTTVYILSKKMPFLLIQKNIMTSRDYICIHLSLVLLFLWWLVTYACLSYTAIALPDLSKFTACNAVNLLRFLRYDSCCRMMKSLYILPVC